MYVISMLWCFCSRNKYAWVKWSFQTYLCNSLYGSRLLWLILLWNLQFFCCELGQLQFRHAFCKTCTLDLFFITKNRVLMLIIRLILANEMYGLDRGVQGLTSCLVCISLNYIDVMSCTDVVVYIVQGSLFHPSSQVDTEYTTIVMFKITFVGLYVCVF